VFRGRGKEKEGVTVAHLDCRPHAKTLLGATMHDVSLIEFQRRSWQQIRCAAPPSTKVILPTSSMSLLKILSL
jgi:hypothetical protein